MSTRGSVWRKWDLHFHSQASYDYENNGITNKEIVDALVQNNIAVIAITDHHFIDVERIKEFQEIGKGKITVLPGIEFRSELGGSDSIHFIGIFSEESDIEDIWREIQVSCKLTESAISKLGGESKVHCDFKETAALIHSLGGIVTIHAGSKSNTLEKITNTLPYKMALKEDLLTNHTDVLELGKEKDQNDYLSIVFPQIKRVLPLIICSDNHNIKEYSIKQNLWIKADPTFEGLRQICFEPEARVKIQANEPDFKDDKLIIDEVKFISPNGVFSDNPILLNKNLNVIIGGKSSGKSILLYSIARVLLPDHSLLKNENNEYKYDLTKLDGQFDFAVTTRGGFTQKNSRGFEENSIIPEIKYIPQNYLVKLAEPELSKKGESLDNIIRSLIKEEEESREIYESFIEKLKQNDKLRTQLINSFFEAKADVERLEKELKSKSNKDVLQKNIESNNRKAIELSKIAGFSEDDVKERQRLQNEVDLNVSSELRLNNDINNARRLNSDLLKSLEEFDQRIEQTLALIETFEVKKYLVEEYQVIKNTLTKVSNIQMIIDDSNNNFNPNNKLSFSPLKPLFEELAKNRNELTKALDPYFKNDETNKQIEAINNSITIDKKLLGDIDYCIKQIEEKQNLVLKIKDKIFALYEENFNEYLTVTNELKKRTTELESDGLKIIGRPRFNFPKLLKEFYVISDGRRSSYSNHEILNEAHKPTSDFEFNTLLTQVRCLFDDIVNNNYALTSKVTIKGAIELLLTDYFFDHWEIIYKNDKLGEMSTGKASFVILMLIIGLSKSKAPILIDQPEDNLDNRSISVELVEYLRKKKLDRQIILVTHNPNIVVNADAENIIVANQKGQNDKETSSTYKFDYINGSLENSFDKKSGEGDLLKSMGIRQHIADIVEGGKDAFLKREKKYRFS